jgi:hypothetical protein
MADPARSVMQNAKMATPHPVRLFCAVLAVVKNGAFTGTLPQAILMRRLSWP